MGCWLQKISLYKIPRSPVEHFDHEHKYAYNVLNKPLKSSYGDQDLCKFCSFEPLYCYEGYPIIIVGFACVYGVFRVVPELSLA